MSDTPVPTTVRWQRPKNAKGNFDAPLQHDIEDALEFAKKRKPEKWRIVEVQLHPEMHAVAAKQFRAVIFGVPVVSNHLVHYGVIAVGVKE